MRNEILQLSNLLDSSIQDALNLFEDKQFIDLSPLYLLNDYYTTRFSNCENNGQRQLLTQEYAHLLETMKKIKSGSLSADEALNNLNRLSRDKKLNVILHNTLKTCELLFWVTAALTSYAFCVGFGIPLLFLNPPLGLALIMGTAVLIIESAAKALETANSFKNLSPINQQKNLEHQVLSLFFSPKKESTFDNEEELADIDQPLLSYC